MRHNKQKGYSLTEIMIAVGVLAAITVGGLSFYSNAIVKAQASQSFIFGKLIVDDVLDFFSRKGYLPANGDNLAGDYVGMGQSYVDWAKWIHDSGGIGHVEVKLQGVGSTVHQSIADVKLFFFLQITDNESSIFYKGCQTTAISGAFDGSDLDNTTAPGTIASPIYPECNMVATPDHTVIP